MAIKSNATNKLGSLNAEPARKGSIQVKGLNNDNIYAPVSKPTNHLALIPRNVCASLYRPSGHEEDVNAHAVVCVAA